MKKPVGEIKRTIINDLCFLISYQIAVTTMSGDKACWICCVAAHNY
jgi:hypothetical protein